MAEGERRLVFDTRGRRKHVVRVVYAVLALLMGSSLFLVVGPFSIADLFNSGSSSSSSSVFEDQAENLERKLRTNPGDEALLLALTRARINAGNSKAEVNSSTGETVITPEGYAELERGVQAWSSYLKKVDDPSTSGAQLVAGTYFSLAEGPFGVEGAVANLNKAASTQRIVAEAQPSVGSLSTLAIYEYFAGDQPAGDLAAKRVFEMIPSKEERKGAEGQLAAYRKRGELFEKQKQKLLKAQREAEQGRGKEALENPLPGLSLGGSAVGE